MTSARKLCYTTYVARQLHLSPPSFLKTCFSFGFTSTHLISMSLFINFDELSHFSWNEANSVLLMSCGDNSIGCYPFFPGELNRPVLQQMLRRPTEKLHWDTTRIRFPLFQKISHCFLCRQSLLFTPLWPAGHSIACKKWECRWWVLEGCREGGVCRCRSSVQNDWRGI